MLSRKERIKDEKTDKETRRLAAQDFLFWLRVESKKPRRGKGGQYEGLPGADWQAHAKYAAQLFDSPERGELVQQEIMGVLGFQALS